MGGRPERGRNQDEPLNAAVFPVLAASRELVMSSHPDGLAEAQQAAQPFSALPSTQVLRPEGSPPAGRSFASQFPIFTVKGLEGPWSGVQSSGVPPYLEAPVMSRRKAA